MRPVILRCEQDGLRLHKAFDTRSESYRWPTPSKLLPKMTGPRPFEPVRKCTNSVPSGDGVNHCEHYDNSGSWFSQAN